MATNTERIDELTQVTALLSAEQKLHAHQLQQAVDANRALREEVAKLRDDHRQLRDEFRQSQKEAEVRAAVVDQRLGELKATQDRWSVRFWQIAIGITLAVVGGVIGYLLKR